MAEYYRISGDTLTAIADRTRVLAGTTDKLTPDEIINCLSAVKVVVRGKASSEAEAWSECFSAAGGATFPYEITGPKCYYNGVLLPGIPGEMLEKYPYVWIRKTEGIDAYDLYFSSQPWYFKDNSMTYAGMGETSFAVAYKAPISTAADTDTWVFGEAAFYTGMLIAETMPVMWSSHDIPNGAAEATEIYFAGSEPVPAE